MGQTLLVGPLDGIRIVELAEMIAVPAATNLLTGQGATSVKVENTTGGDNLRPYGSQKNGMGAWFANANAGKRSIALDLGRDEAKAVLYRLVDEADVFVQGLRPGAVDRLGFGAETLTARNPQLVHVSAAGFGADGPYAERPVYDPVIQSHSGWAGAQQTDDGPTLIRGMVADKVAAYTVAQAITAALVSRARTGRGQAVEVSMLEANLAFNWPDVMMHCTLLDDDAVHLPNLLSYYRLFRSSDGWVCVTAGNDQQWRAACEACDRPDLADDERLATAAGRGRNMEHWYDSFEAMLRPFTTAELLDRMAAADVPAVAVLRPDQVVDDPQVRARDAVEEVDHPIVGRMRVPRPGARFAADGEVRPAPAPAYAAGTDEILAELGYDAEQVAALRASGAVA